MGLPDIHSGRGSTQDSPALAAAASDPPIMARSARSDALSVRLRACASASAQRVAASLSEVTGSKVGGREGERTVQWWGEADTHEARCAGG